MPELPRIRRAPLAERLAELFVLVVLALAFVVALVVYHTIEKPLLARGKRVIARAG